MLYSFRKLKCFMNGFILYDFIYACMTMKLLYVLQTLIIVSYLPLLCEGQSFDQGLGLLDNLFKNYDRRLRPSLNQSLPTHVNVSFLLLNIEDFDEVNAKFSVTGALHEQWYDEKIRWNASDYGGIQSQMLPLRDVWYPPLILIYPHGKYDDFVDDWMLVRYFNDGHAYFSPGAVFQSACSIDVTYYPFDVQTCSLIFLPWSYFEWEVKLNSPMKFIDRSYFIEHGEWEIIENASVVSDPFVNTVRFTFKLQRKSLFFVVNIILPIVIMSFLNILIFALPPQSGERISYGITVLLAIAVFLTIVGDNLPKTSNPMSILSYFLMINLTISAIMCLFAIINMRIYFRDDEEPLTYWAFSIIRVGNCACRRLRRPRPRKLTTKLTRQNGSEILYNIDKRLDSHKPVDSDTNVTPENETLNWRNVSKAIDQMCLIFFSLAVLTNTLTFILLAILGPN